MKTTTLITLLFGVLVLVSCTLAVGEDSQAQQQQQKATITTTTPTTGLKEEGGGEGEEGCPYTKAHGLTDPFQSLQGRFDKFERLMGRMHNFFDSKMSPLTEWGHSPTAHHSHHSLWDSASNLLPSFDLSYSFWPSVK